MLTPSTVCRSDVRASPLCRSRSPDLDPFAIRRAQTTEVGQLHRLGALEEKLDKCFYVWYNLRQDEISVIAT